MKKISIVIPCYNEVENVALMAFTADNEIGSEKSRGTE